MDKRFVERSKRMFTTMRRAGMTGKRVYIYDKSKKLVGSVSWTLAA